MPALPLASAGEQRTGVRRQLCQLGACFSSHQCRGLRCCCMRAAAMPIICSFSINAAACCLSACVRCRTSQEPGIPSGKRGAPHGQRGAVHQLRRATLCRPHARVHHPVQVSVQQLCRACDVCCPCLHVWLARWQAAGLRQASLAGRAPRCSTYPDTSCCLLCAGPAALAVHRHRRACHSLSQRPSAAAATRQARCVAA
jgi:hypothetical protein